MLKTLHHILFIMLTALAAIGLDLDPRAAAGQWEETVSVAGEAGQGSEIVVKEFELAADANVKIKWDLTSTGSASMFRATLERFDEATKKYVNAGVLVRASVTGSKEQPGNLGAGKHRVTFSIKRMRYKFSILAQR